jgi:hypothetical protein
MMLATFATTSFASAQPTENQATTPTTAPLATNWTITPAIYFPGGNATLVYPPELFAFATGLNTSPAGTVEVRRGKFSAFVDASSASMAQSSTRIVNAPGLPSAYVLNQQMATTENAFTAAIGYTVYRKAASNVDVFGGARLFGVDDYLNNQVTYPGIPGQTSSVGESRLYMDAVAGVRGRIGVGGAWYLPYYADLGAGGAGFSWQENSGLGYDFGKAGAVSVTYRNLYLNRNGKKENVVNGLNFGGPSLNYAIKL